jgi:hypothetical protein
MGALPPPGLYPDPRGISGQVYWDGQEWHLTPAPRKASPVQTAAIAIVAVAIVGVVSIVGYMAWHKQAAIQRSDEASQSTVQAPLQQPVVNLNREVRDGKLAFVVTNVDTSNVATGPGTYVNVHMTVKNTGDRPRTFWADNQRLWSEGQPFFPDSKAAARTGASNVKINPGNSASVVVSFDIPDGTAAVDTIELHDTALSQGVNISLRP